MSPQTFKIGVDRWIRRAKAAPDAFLRVFVTELAKEVIIRTPVDTGFLRGSWFLSTSAQAENSGSEDQAGAIVAAKIAVQASKAKAGTRLYLLNSASYGPFVEYGTANTAPRYFVRSTALQAPQIAARVAKAFERAR